MVRPLQRQPIVSLHEPLNTAFYARFKNYKVITQTPETVVCVIPSGIILAGAL